jgi:alpha-L-arabinofuranosidase
MANDAAEIIVLGNQTIGELSEMLFGQFIELTGRCINNGLHDPQSPLARPDGVRPDVVAALKELRPAYIRYPGGCGTAFFNWQELAGPVAQRPRAKLFRTTRVPQSTAFGIPEAWALCREVGAELYFAVNANTQSPEDAANLVEYLNGTTPTKWADLRRAHGREEPYGVKLFGLGNEIYGDWQPGQKTAPEYVAWCREAIRQMKAVDPTIATIACGCGRFDPAWDRTVLNGLADSIDMISIHNYFGRPVFRDNMAASLVCQQMLDQMNTNIGEMLDRNLARKARPGMAFDEWNVWYRTTHDPAADVEEIYNYTDALTVATLMHVIFRNARTIRIANASLLVNTIGSIFTDRTRSVRQTIFYPQRLLHDTHHKRVVNVAVDGPTFTAKHERFFCGIVDVEKAKDETLPTLVHFRDVPALDAVASVDDGRRRMTLSVVQKLEDRPLKTRLTFRGLQPSGASMTVHRLTGDGLLAENTLDHPNRVGVVTETVPFTDAVTLPPASLTVFEFGW